MSKGSLISRYEDGKVGCDINSDGVGYIYYPDGKIAVVSSPATDYQNRFFAFDRDRKSTVLLGVDEYAVGFTSYSKRKAAAVSPSQCVLSKVGVLVSLNGAISREWKWDSKSPHAGSPPDSLLDFDLNECLTFKIKSKQEMSLVFQCQNVKAELDLGVKVRRESTYLDNATRDIDGKITPHIEWISLKERTAKFNEEMRGLRNKLNPRSENLTEMVSGIVGGLESNFDNIADKLKNTTGPGISWKETSLASTLKELPKIPVAGTETGLNFGFGEHLYTSDPSSTLAKTAPAEFMTANGDWMGEVDIRSTLREMNPPLPRNRVLDGNSGRYSSMLVVNRSEISAHNPTGGTTLTGVPLQAWNWDSNPTLGAADTRHKPSLKSQLQLNGPNTITAVLVTRGGDVSCFGIERVAEVAKERLDTVNASATGPGSKLIHLVKVDIADNYGIISEYGIKSIPTFLVFRGNELAYAGPLGGKKFKLLSQPYRPQVLLIEPNFSVQVDSEKLLKKMGADPFLCLNIAQATERVRRFSLTAGRNAIIFDIVLIPQDIPLDGIIELVKSLSDFVKDKRTIIAATATILGDKGKLNFSAVDWTNHYTTEVVKLLRPELAMAAKVAILSPIKAVAIERLLSLRDNHHSSNSSSEFGLTPDTMLSRLYEIKEGKAQNRSNNLLNMNAVNPNYVGIKLSAEDARLKNGRKLVS